MQIVHFGDVFTNIYIFSYIYNLGGDITLFFLLSLALASLNQ
jgi:hypothetical protein